MMSGVIGKHDGQLVGAGIVGASGVELGDYIVKCFIELLLIN